MTIEDLSARLEKVERANRSMKRWGGGLLTLLVAGVAMAASFAGETVTAKAFEVRDDSGNVRAILGVDSEDRGGLWLYDDGGTLTGYFGSTQSGNAAMQLQDSGGSVRLRLLGGDQWTGVYLFNGSGGLAATMHMKYGRPEFGFQDEDEVTRYLLALPADPKKKVLIRNWSQSKGLPHWLEFE